MKTSWLAGLNDQDKDDLKASMLAAAPTFERLTKLLEDKLKAIDKERRSKKNYLLPTWKYYQADCNGYSRALEELLNLIPDQGNSNE